MTRDELLQLIDTVRQPQCELQDLEVKAAAGGTPTHLYQELSSFANRPGGGVILCGLDERQGFAVVGVRDAQRLQEDVTNLGSSEMEPPLRLGVTVETVEGSTVVAFDVPEVPAEQKPCYYRPRGLPGGAFIRVGNTDRPMTEYEVFSYVSAQKQLTFDDEVVPRAVVADLDRLSLQAYVAALQRQRPSLSFLRLPLEDAVEKLGIVVRDGDVLRPTLAGLLVFGEHPQLYVPQLVIVFMQFYGTTETEAGPRGERFLDNQKFTGPVPTMLQEAENHIVSRMRRSALIEGLLRRDIFEYPETALREALVNAVAHRDYSHYVRGSQIQVKMFADRLEVTSPGGLYGSVTVDNLEDGQSTRNPLLMQFMEDLHLVENRGSGVDNMVEAMRDAQLAPPEFVDRRERFQVSFRNHTMLDPVAIGWLNQFAGYVLNERHRRALVYLRYNDSISNAGYRRLNRADSREATAELRSLVATQLVAQTGARGGTRYVLTDQAKSPAAEPGSGSETAGLLAFVRQRGSIDNEKCRELLAVDRRRATYLLANLVASGELVATGTGRWTRYRLPASR